MIPAPIKGVLEVGGAVSFTQLDSKKSRHFKYYTRTRLIFCVITLTPPDFPMLVDAHTHLHGYPDSLLPTVLEQIERYSIRTLAVAIDLPTYHQSRALAERSDLIIPALGIHPWQAADNADMLDALAPYLAEVPIIGEIGLDFHWIPDTKTYPTQRRIFEWFLAAARDVNKPVNLHTKGAEGDVLKYLRHFGIQHALIHWYSGDRATFEALIEDGHYFTMGVELLFSEQSRAFACALPLDQLLTETDNPGGLPWLCEQHPDALVQWQPYLIEEVAMPGAILPVYEALAEIKEVTVPQLESIIETNLERYVAGR